MALSVTSSFLNKTNSVMVLASDPVKQGIAVRVASLASDTLGILTAAGSASVNWSIVGAPAWVIKTVSPDTLTCTLLFNSAQPQTDPYQFYVVCTTGTETIYFPVLLEVREPFFIAEQNGNTVLNIPSYDSTVADIVINGYGLNNTQLTSGVRFIQPSSIPGGLNLVTTSEAGALLRVDQPTTANVPGGMQAPGTTQLTLLAYKPGSFYDTPDRAFQANFTIQSLTTKVGVLDLAMATFYKSSTNVVRAESLYDYLQGQGKTLTYSWSTSGSATVALSAGGGSETTNAFAEYSVSVAGTLTITLTMKDSNHNTVAVKSVGPFHVDVTGTWVAGSAIKVDISPETPSLTGFAGDTLSFLVTAEVAAGESVFLSFVLANAGSTETTISNPSPVTLHNAGGSPAVLSTSVPVVLPVSTPHQKWTLNTTAANSGGSPPATRTGYAQFNARSNGLPVQSVNLAGGNTIASNTGTSIAPTGLTSTGGSSTFRLQGAPDGLLIQNNNLVGNALKPGSYTFKVSAEQSGYARSFSTTVTLNVTALALPLVITPPTVNFQSIQDNTQFTVSWGYTGTPTDVTMEQNFTIRDVLGVTQATTTQQGSSVVSIYGVSFFGPAYSLPLFVLSTTAAALAKLQGAPTIGSIDENFLLTLNWQPVEYNGDPTYAIYKAWDIFLNLNNTGPQLQSLSTGLPTGLEFPGSSLTNRIFQEQLVTGDYTVSMTALSNDQTIALNSDAWDAFHAFPAVLLSTQVTLDKQTALLGESVTITLDPLYTGADQWRVIFPDNSTTGWLPLSIKSIAKAFNTSGDAALLIETERNFSSANPAVRLRRQVTKTVFISDVQFQAPGANSSSVTDNTGFGGESGFEITSAQGGTTTPDPYEVVVRSIVKDSVTNELKLMVATTRFQDASSLLGTMAMDVFPLPGRPHDKSLIKLVRYLTVQPNTSAVPVSVTTQQSNVPQIIVGKPMSEFKLSANGGTIPYTWYSDNLPFGLNLSADGTLSGTILRLGTFAVHFAVSDQSEPAFIAEATLNIISTSDLLITTSTLPAATVGTPYSFAMLNTGGLPPFTWTIVAGALPIGLSIDPNTGIVSGIPSTYNSSTDFNKTYTATIQVTDSIGAKYSVVVSMTLSPAALSLTALDQPNIFASQDFKFSASVFGGRSPYSLTSFSELAGDIVIGNGLAVVNPDTLDVVAGIAPPTLQITTTDQVFYPLAFPINMEFPLAASGGVAPYKFFIDPNGNTNLPGAAVYGEIVVASPTANGTFQVSVKCVDSVGHITSANLNVLIQQKNDFASDFGTYTIKAVSVNLNGTPSTPSNWTITPITAGLPDAKNGTAWAPGGGGTYYGLAVYENNVLHMTQNNGSVGQMTHNLRSGTLPAGLSAPVSGTTVAGSGDFSGIVLFGYSGGWTPSANGAFSFEYEFTNIQPVSGAPTQMATRESITVTTPGGGTSAAVVITTTDELDLDLNTISGTPYGWFYPINAEGGSGSYNIAILSGTTLPGATLVPLGNGVAIASQTTQIGSYVVLVQATDSNNVQSPVVTIDVVLTQSVAQAIHILSTNLPAYFYKGRAITPNTFYVEADLIAAWSATGLPAGISLTTTPNQRVYLSGTPTTTGVNSIIFTATSTTFGTKASATYSLQIKPRSALITTSPTSAVINTPYRVVSNNAILAVTYIGYQPTDADLPTLTADIGTVGSPNTPGTTGNSNLTNDGFIMQYDYSSAAAGAETIVLTDGSSTFDTKAFNDIYPQLQAVGQSVSASVSEYATTADFNPPVLVSGGQAPYTVNLIGFSDSRFTDSGSGKVRITVNQFTPGGTYSCIVSMTVTDSSTPTQSVNVTGTLSVTVSVETTDTIIFSDGTWAFTVTGGAVAQVATFDPDSLANVQLAHLPVQYYVDSVSLPGGLTVSSQTLVTVSPTKRVLAIKFGGSNTSTPDLGSDLNPSGSFNAIAQNTGNAPTVGQYTIVCALRVVDSKGVSTTHSVNVVLTLS